MDHDNDTRLVRLHPNLLLSNVPNMLAPRIDDLKRLFPDSPKILMRAPHLLFHDVDSFIVPKMEELRDLLPGADVARLIR